MEEKDHVMYEGMDMQISGPMLHAIANQLTMRDLTHRGDYFFNEERSDAKKQ